MNNYKKYFIKNLFFNFNQEIILYENNLNDKGQSTLLFFFKSH